MEQVAAGLLGNHLRYNFCVAFFDHAYVIIFTGAGEIGNQNIGAV